MSKIKPKFTEKEIEELNDVYQKFGYQCGIHEVVEFVKQELNISEVHKLSISMRKYFNVKINEQNKKFEKKYKNSTLQDKLIKRMNYE
jgi:hypothetical protein